jgi:hypothetical protein
VKHWHQNLFLKTGCENPGEEADKSLQSHSDYNEVVVSIFNNQILKTNKNMSNDNSTKRGRFTLPAQEGMDKEVLELAQKWGVDIIATAMEHNFHRN